MARRAMSSRTRPSSRPISDSNTRSGTPAMAEPLTAEPLIIELQGLCAGYGEVQVLWGVDMKVRQSEITALIGSNGAGKTTLMRVLSGLVPIRSGFYFGDWRGGGGDNR